MKQVRAATHGAVDHDWARTATYRRLYLMRHMGRTESSWGTTTCWLIWKRADE